MGRKFVFFRIEKNIAIVEMSDEKKKNALSYDLLFELKNTLQEIEKNDEIRTLILSGKGDSFCSGMDVEWLLKEDSISMRKANRWIQEVFSYVEHYKNQ
jgi:enoyl-CoA hydratase/carnithine racemase